MPMLHNLLFILVSEICYPSAVPGGNVCEGNQQASVLRKIWYRVPGTVKLLWSGIQTPCIRRSNNGMRPNLEFNESAREIGREVLRKKLPPNNLTSPSLGSSFMWGF